MSDSASGQPVSNGFAERPAGAPKMRLRYAPFSPFARKVLVAAFESGCESHLDLLPADVWAEDTDIYLDNPIGKVPALVAGEGAFVGSGLICEYLDSLHDGPKLIPRTGVERWTVLRSHALADGLLEAAVAHVVERLRRPKTAQWDGWLLRQERKIACTLEALDRRELVGAFDLAGITLACALAYLDFRLPSIELRVHQPALAAWLNEAAERRSMQATTPERLSALASGLTVDIGHK